MNPVPARPDQPDDGRSGPARPAGPPNQHQLALMIWLAVFPTLTLIRSPLRSSS